MNVEETSVKLLEMTLQAAIARHTRDLLKSRDFDARAEMLRSIDALHDVELELRKGLTSG